MGDLNVEEDLVQLKAYMPRNYKKDLRKLF